MPRTSCELNQKARTKWSHDPKQRHVGELPATDELVYRSYDLREGAVCQPRDHTYTLRLLMFAFRLGYWDWLFAAADFVLYCQFFSQL